MVLPLLVSGGGDLVQFSDTFEVYLDIMINLWISKIKTKTPSLEKKIDNYRAPNLKAKILTSSFFLYSAIAAIFGLLFARFSSMAVNS